MRRELEGPPLERNDPEWLREEDEDPEAPASRSPPLDLLLNEENKLDPELEAGKVNDFSVAASLNGSF